MKLRLIIFAVLAFSMVFGGALLAQEAPPWAYEGEAGPENWVENYPDCDNAEQSPIDISTVSVDYLDVIPFDYLDSALNIFNNGHTIQATYDAGSTIFMDNVSYELKQFHFHAPSEHTINGQPFPMELHLVHQSDEGAYAVVGVMLGVAENTDQPGAIASLSDNPALAPVFANLPTEVSHDNPPTPHTVEGVTISAADFLPADQTYFTYDGSFTTPPCTEGVKWYVLTQPVGISQAQLDAYTALHSNTARPPQPLGEREVTASLENG